jgi:RHS repeat-associated protein
MRAESYVGTSDLAWRQAGSVTTTALVDADGARVGSKSGASASWLLFDLLGSVAGLEGTAATTVTDAFRYDAYGGTIGRYPSGGSAVPVRFRGLLDIGPTADPDTAGAGSDPTYLMGDRVYSPHLGSFTQLDSYAGDAQNPLSMNRFLYALGNPATLIDPSGHYPVWGGGGNTVPPPPCGTPGGNGTPDCGGDDTPPAPGGNNTPGGNNAPNYGGSPTSSTGQQTAGGSVPVTRVPTSDQRDDWRTDKHRFCVPAHKSFSTGQRVAEYCETFDAYMKAWNSNYLGMSKERVCAEAPDSWSCLHYEFASKCDRQCAVAQAEIASIVDPTPASSIILAAYYCSSGDAGNCVVNVIGALPLVGKVRSAGKAGEFVLRYSDDVGEILYRTGSLTEGSLTDLSGVSFRNSISSSADRVQVFKPGEKIWAVDVNKLPPGSIVRNNRPDGHVSVYATPDQIRAAIIEAPWLQQLKPLADGTRRLPK